MSYAPLVTSRFPDVSASALVIAPAPLVADEECLHGMDMAWCSTCNKIDDSFLGRMRSHNWTESETKQEVFDDIADRIGAPRRMVGVGSSLPSELFEDISLALGIAYTSMPEVCESVVLQAGMKYSSSFDSRLTDSGGGSTVTLEGLLAMRSALEKLLPS